VTINFDFSFAAQPKPATFQLGRIQWTQVMRFFVPFLIAALMFNAGGCRRSSADAIAGEPGKELRVLFIGNSLTQSNNLPAIVQALAAAGGQAPLVYKSVLLPGTSLEDQWNNGRALAALRAEKWNVVVLQQGPSSLPESRTNLIEYTRRFDKEIRKAGGVPALYMVWPESSRPKAFDAVSGSYAAAAKDVNGVLFPAGEAWRAAWRRDPKLKLYADDLHPNVAGSYLVGLVMYQQLYKQSPIGLPAKLSLKNSATTTIEVPAEQVRLLQEAAAEANAKFGKP
jgi:hypothetical protein